MLNATKDRKERVGRILQMHANHREDKDGVFAGDIVAAVGLKNTTTGDTLCDPSHPIVLERMEFPEPVISVAIEPKTKADQDKLGKALGALSEEDPTFQVRTDDETGQTIIGGMGELHLEVLVDRMMREFAVGANVGKPQVAYRETITEPVEKIEERYVRQTGGRGQYGHVVISLEPTGPGGGYEFVDKIVGGVIPREYIPAVDAGIQEALEGGVIAGLPARRRAGHPHLRLVPRRRLERDGVQDRRVDGVQEGRPPGQAGAARADHGGRGRHARGLHGRRHRRPRPRGGARSRAWSSAGTSHVVNAKVPLAEMFGYATDLRSRTQGRATYTMQFDSYQQVPESIAAGDHRPRPRRVAAPSTSTRKHTRTDARGASTAMAKAEVRADEAASEHWDDWSYRPWEDDVDGGDHAGVGGARTRT